MLGCCFVVAERIAAERGEQVGKTVGYQVGINLEKKIQHMYFSLDFHELMTQLCLCHPSMGTCLEGIVHFLDTQCSHP